jgi:two-component system, OmpR family, response regulator BaeR
MSHPAGPPAAAATPPLVLIVEDEPTLSLLLSETLRAEGYATHALARGDEVVDYVRAQPPAAILLDINLPGRNGLDVCRDLRGFSTVPLIMITGRVEEIDRLLGLELGADDYICKPFTAREVVARVRALLRRVRDWRDPGDGGGVPTSLRLDDERFEAWYQGVKLDLTPVEHRLLKALGARPGRVLSRNQLLDAIYVDHRVVSDRTVDSHVKNLRRKLTDAGGGVDPIESIYGVGYKFSAG